LAGSASTLVLENWPFAGMLPGALPICTFAARTSSPPNCGGTGGRPARPS
jgi:hypothetical protein